MGPDFMTSCVTIGFSNMNLLPRNDNVIPVALYYNDLAVIGLTRWLAHRPTVCERLAFSVRYALWPKSFPNSGRGGGVVCQVGREAEETIEHRICNTAQTDGSTPMEGRNVWFKLRR